MKTLAELNAIRDKMKPQLNMREEDEDSIRVVVGMATCGIAAGARPVLKALSNAVQERGLKNVAVVQTGCIGLCKLEPIVEVIKGNEKVTYVKMTVEKAEEVITRHIVGGHVVKEYTIDSENLK